MGVSQNGWLVMENPIKMDNLGIPPFQETSICLMSILSDSQISQICISDKRGRVLRGPRRDSDEALTSAVHRKKKKHGWSRG
jgi:hypothetical protein